MEHSPDKSSGSSTHPPRSSSHGITGALGLRDSAAAVRRQSLITVGMAAPSGNKWSNRRKAQRFSKASWMTARSGGDWMVNDNLVVPGMKTRSVSLVHTIWGMPCSRGGQWCYCHHPPVLWERWQPWMGYQVQHSLKWPQMNPATMASTKMSISL